MSLNKYSCKRAQLEILINHDIEIKYVEIYFFL